jgi:uncharacterized protein
MAYVAVDPFDVALGELRDRRGTFHVVRRGTLADALVAEVDSRVPAGAEVEADVVLDAFDGGVSVTGRVSSRWEGECRRCLRSLDGELSTDVRELFRRGGGQDDGTYRMGEDHLNLREMVMDTLFAALPLLPLCVEDCHGICPRCGADRNTAPCGCQEVEVDRRWAALDVLRLAQEAEAEPEPLG